MSGKRQLMGHDSSNQQSTRSSRRSSNRLSWFLAVGFAVLLVVAAVIINVKHEEDSIVKVNDSLDIDNGDEKIDWSRFPTVDLHLTKSTTINKAGTYHLTGEIVDGGLTIDVGETAVKLILDEVSIENTTGPAIYCKSADDLVIELVGNNYLEDGTKYATDYDTEVSGVLYSEGDLTFTGTGSLNIFAKYADGIVGKDDVKFTGGEYSIDALDDAIRGTDSVYIVDGTFTIDATASAIKSTNETEPKKGFVLIEDGSFSVIAGDKGLKAVNAVIVKNGNLVLETFDDAIHSDNFVGISNGTINISAGDDAIHANNELLIDNGEINIAKSYEGLEAQAITINGGNLKIAASDDGINAGGGDNTTSNNDPFKVDEKCIISINGGAVAINASGDGIDSNGWLYFNGGSVIVDGPTNDSNGALDAGAGILMNNGEVIAVGASGMAENLGSYSSVFNLSVFFDEILPAGTRIEILNSRNETILEHTAMKQFSHLAVGSPQLFLGETYTIRIDDSDYQTFAITEITTTLGSDSHVMMPRDNQPR